MSKGTYLIDTIGKTSGTTITVDGKEFPNIPVYAPAGKPLRFVSIELWNADPEYADTDQIWEHKRGVHAVEAGGTYQIRWSVSFQ